MNALKFTTNVKSINEIMGQILGKKFRQCYDIFYGLYLLMNIIGIFNAILLISFKIYSFINPELEDKFKINDVNDQYFTFKLVSIPIVALFMLIIFKFRSIKLYKFTCFIIFFSFFYIICITFY